MSDTSDNEVVVAEEATPDSMGLKTDRQTDTDTGSVTDAHTDRGEPSQSSRQKYPTTHESSDSQPVHAAAAAASSAVIHSEACEQTSNTISTATTSSNSNAGKSNGTQPDHRILNRTSTSVNNNSATPVDCTTNTTPATCTITSTSTQAPTSTSSTTAAAAAKGPSTSTPVVAGQRFPDQLRRNFSQEVAEEEDWEELGEDSGSMGNVAGSILGYSPLIYETTNNDGEDEGQLDELYVPIQGYEVMEQRAKFTVFKLNVQKTPGEGYFIFRRYTDFTRLNYKLKILFPMFRLALPPKRWFGNNFDPIFLEDRLLGLQAFLNNITGHKDIRRSEPVKEFLCLNDPPGPHDSLEESRVMVESLEEMVYNLRRDIAERDRIIKKKDAEIASLKARLGEAPQDENNPELPFQNERPGTDQDSESSTVEGDCRSCVEADQLENGIRETSESQIKVSIETVGKEPIKWPVGNGGGAIAQSTALCGNDSR